MLSDDVPALPKPIKARIQKAIERKLQTRPLLFGVPLRGSLVSLWKLRVGDHRIVFDVVDEVVYVPAIGHRRHIYTRIASKWK